MRVEENPNTRGLEQSLEEVGTVAAEINRRESN